MISDLDCVKLCAACYSDPGAFDLTVQTQGVWFGVKDTGDCVVAAFRGSDNIPDWRRDIEAQMENYSALYGYEKGFGLGLPTAIKRLRELTGAMPLVLTGHSLGAAHAALVAPQSCPGKVVLFGCPRPGDARLRAYMERQNISITSYRNRRDPVTELPDFSLSLPLVKFAPVADFIPLDAAPACGDELTPFLDHHINLYVQGMEKYDADRA